MAISVTVGTPTDVSGSGVHTWSEDIGTPKALVVAITQGQFDPTVTAVSVGGVALTKRVQAAWSVAGHRRAEIWVHDAGDLVITDTQTVSITASQATGSRWATLYSVTADGSLAVVDSGADARPAETYIDTLDSGDALAMAFACIYASGMVAAIAGYTEDLDEAFADPPFPTATHVHAHQTTPSTGSRAVGFSGNGLHAGVGILLAEGAVVEAVVVAFDAGGIELGGEDFTVEPAGDAHVILGGVRRLLLGGGRFSIVPQGPRQVALVDGGRTTAEFTEGGTEGQVLTYHEAAKPSWEPLTPGGISEITDLPTAETDTDLRLAPDGTGGVEWAATVGGGIPSGTAFPGSPSAGDLFHRTDLPIAVWRYDGTRWLCTCVHDVSFGQQQALGASLGTSGRVALGAAGFDIYIDEFVCTIFVSGTNNVSNFWTVTFAKHAPDDASTAIVTFNTSALSGSTWLSFAGGAGEVVDVSSHPLLRWGLTETGNTSCSATAKVKYRYIAT